MAQASPDAEDGTVSGSTVFFSYSRVDFPQAERVIRLLEKHGFNVWWDGKLEAGVKYVESTQHALESAQAVVVAWTANSASSHWVRDEAMVGRDSNRLVPITLDGALPPLGFRQFQVLDFSKWNGKADAAVAQELLRATAALTDLELGGKSRAPSGPTSAAVLITRPFSRRQGLRYLGVAGAVAAIGGAGAGALKLFGAHDTLASGNSLAVLPFANDSSDPGQDYLSSGLAAELRSMLARNQALRVVARSSSEVVKKRGMEAVAAAKELGVAYIVEGSVRVIGNAVRVSSDLIDGKTGLGRWSRTYDETLQGLLALQDTLARSISTELTAQVSAAEQGLKLGLASVPAAFNAYLRGWDLFTHSSSTATDLEVLGYFQTAARLDEKFAGARAGEAAAYLALGHTSASSASAASYYDKAVSAARSAVSLGPDLAEAHSVLAQTMFEAQLKVAEAKQSFERSLQSGAGMAAIQARYAEYEALTGQHANAKRAIETAIMLDPLNPAIFKSAGLVNYAAGDHTQAIAMQRQALALDGAVSGSHAWIASSLMLGGKLQEALKECEQEPFVAMRLAGLAIIQQKAGNMAAASLAMNALTADYGDAAAYQQAQVLAQWGNVAAAQEKLALARKLGDAGLTYLLVDPLLGSLRERAGYRDLLQGLGFSQVSSTRG